MPEAQPVDLPSDYRLAPLLIARFVGLSLVLLAVVMFGGTAVVSLLDLPADLLVVILVLGVVGVFSLAWVLRNKAYVVRCDQVGYRVRFVRGAGVTQARWTEVVNAATASPREIPCVILHLSDGRTTTIPVQALAVDREEFVRDLQAHLRRGQGLRPL